MLWSCISITDYYTDLTLFLSVICHTPLPDVAKVRVADALHLQQRFAEIVSGIFTSIKTQKWDKLEQILQFAPPPEKWVERSKQDREVIS